MFIYHRFNETRDTIGFLLYIGISLTVFGFCNNQAYADQESFPFLAESTGDHVNVRAGQSANFERLCQLSKGEEIAVVGKEYSWYKVQLPLSAKSFVSKDYVQYLGQNAGGITASSVNIRAGAGIHHTVLGRLTKGEQIFIQEEFDKWYRIEPVMDSYGWVAAEFLTFKSKDTSSYEVRLAPKSFINFERPEKETVIEDQSERDAIEKILLEADGKGKEDINGEAAENKMKSILEEVDSEIDDEKANKAVEGLAEKRMKKFYKEGAEKPDREDRKSENEGIISVVGYVEPYESEGVDGIYYKIIAEAQPVAYIQGTNHMLGRFLHYRVSVSGTVNQKLQPRYDYPVLNILKIRLML